MRKILFLLLLAITYSCGNTASKSDLPAYEVLEDKVYDIPLKSQVSLRVILKDSTIDKQQLTDLIQSLSSEQLDRSMNYHSTPTHVFIYVYNSKVDYDNNSGSWVAMYQKVGEDDTGDYSYKNESLD